MHDAAKILFLTLTLIHLPTASAAAPSQDAAEWVVTDPESDVRFDVSVDAAPALPLTQIQPIDLLELRIREPNRTHIQFELTSAGRVQDTPDDTLGSLRSLEATHRISFKIPDSQLHGILVANARGPRSDGNLATRTTAAFYVCQKVSDDERNCSGQGGFRQLSVKSEGERLVFDLPKAFLIRGNDANRLAAQLPETIYPGKSLEEIQVRAQLRGTILYCDGCDPSFQDFLPDTGFAPSFEMTPTAVAGLRVTPADLVIPAGTETGVSVQLHNNASNTRRIAVNVLPPPPGATWTATSPGPLTLRAGESANITLRVHPGVDPEDAFVSIVVPIEVRVENENDAAAFEVPLLVVPAWKEGPTTLFVHGGDLIGQTPAGVPDVAFFTWSETFLSRVSDDARAQDERPIMFSTSFCAPCLPIVSHSVRPGMHDGATLLDGASGQIVIEDTPMIAQVVIDSGMASSGPLMVQLFGSEGTLLAEGSQDVSLIEGRNVFQVPMPWLIPPVIGNNIPWLRSEIMYLPLTPQQGMLPDELGGDIVLVPVETRFDFNVSRVVPSAPLSTDPMISIGFHEPRSAFANPNKKTVFEFSVTNNDEVVRELDLRVATATRGLRFEILPGPSMRLEPGQSTRLGLALTLPGSAQETQSFAAMLTIHDAVKDSLLAELEFVLTATTGVDLEPEEFELPDQLVAFDDQTSRKSPDWVFGGVVSLGICTLLVRGRKRKNP